MIILNGILWHKLQLLPIFRVHILVWNDLWSYWTIVSCYEMGVEKWKWYEMSILLILNVCVTKWVHFAIWLILDQSEQNSLTLLIFVMKWVTHIGQYEWFYLYDLIRLPTQPLVFIKAHPKYKGTPQTTIWTVWFF